MSYTRIDLPGGRWVAVVRDEESGAYGGTLWSRGSDGNDYADGATAGFPVTGDLPISIVAEQIAAIVEKENA